MKEALLRLSLLKGKQADPDRLIKDRRRWNYRYLVSWRRIVKPRFLVHNVGVVEQPMLSQSRAGASNMVWINPGEIKRGGKRERGIA